MQGWLYKMGLQNIEHKSLTCDDLLPEMSRTVVHARTFQACWAVWLVQLPSVLGNSEQGML